MHDENTELAIIMGDDDFFFNLFNSSFTVYTKIHTIYLHDCLQLTFNLRVETVLSDKVSPVLKGILLLSTYQSLYENFPRHLRIM